ncbi:Peptidase A1 [Macrophomina phaseolina MS6]|uniref:Peptidase A1 n=1 Tax=Macrophomina phaseolina (strain MS6) TaxID=1126212 RepID=K2SJK1_MACPH|nr:Peptidase A1 [Macrophomina phaseolina MS6]
MAIHPRTTTVPAPYVVPTTDRWDGSDGAWSTFSISIGTPPQSFRVLVSTLGQETWVPVPEGCTSLDPSNCADSRGVETFNSAASPGFRTNASSTWELIGLYDLGLETALNYSGNGLFGYDTVRLGSGQDPDAISVAHQVVAGIAAKDYFLGLLGLNAMSSSFSSVSEPVDSLLHSLKQQNGIPSLSYSYTAGASYRFKKVPGSLILGGYDRSRFEVPGFNFTFASEHNRDLIVGVQSIVASNSLQGVVSLTLSGHLSLIDSTIPHIWLPEDVCERFEKAFGLTYDPSTDLYLVNETAHAKLLELSPSITFKLGNSIYTSDNASTNIVLPYAAFDQQVSWPYYTNATYNYFPIRRGANETQYQIGRTLLQEAYLVVDQERRNFSIGQTIFSDPLPEVDLVAILSPNDSALGGLKPGSSGLSTGAIVGIAIGALVVVLVIVAIIFLRRRHRRRSPLIPEVAEDQAAPEQEHVPVAQLDGLPVHELAASHAPAGLKRKCTPPQELSGAMDDTAIFELPSTVAYEMDATELRREGTGRGDVR